MPAPPRYAVNCSILLKGRPIAQRLEAARKAGFEAVEFWWPFTTAAPGDAEVEGFIQDVRESGLQLVGLNLFAGDMAGGDRGVVSWPGREAELRDSVAIAAHVGEAVDCRAFNALYGNRRPGVPADEQDAVAQQNLALAATELARIGGVVLLEPVSGSEHYPLRTAEDVVAVIDRVKAETGADIGLLLDMYHLSVNGDDVPAAITRHRSRIAHVQVADAPGRGAPGTGELPLRRWIDDLLTGGYGGWIALEYASESADPFAWLTEGRSSEGWISEDGPGR